ncbi:MAG TPA: phospholipase D-like domain-containing protein [Oligoflexus sp.]|uniref:phospholipase D-like domain-containing protein n=1 Tax=Oligoflexus sp. TaxID=1971216 RepID=UPI002D707132|nr:phospholipase D-like domain-containing protein [Oligoflexus sp.]HYX32976.1 phospholipase D-like domain-containing protein [Oligoflexus sp.]
MKLNPFLLFIAAWAILGCSTLPDASDPVAQLQLVESVPVETDLGNPDMPKAEAVWMDMISKARESIHVSQFYVQTVPHSSLDRVLKAMEAAAARGIKIQFLVDEAFVKRYPDDTGKAVEAIKKWPNTEVRITNRWTKSGGIQHAKYFVVDSRDAFLGSQNFDWRALDHIKELGFRLRSPPLVGSLMAVFQDDWTKAFNKEAAQELDPKLFQPAMWKDADGTVNTVSLKVSPNPDSNNPVLWDLPPILQMVREAKTHVRIAAMLYKPSFFDKRTWTELESLLIEAAKRGVKVQVMVDQKNKPVLFKNLIEGGVQVGFVKIPTHSSGVIPYARLVHAKYMVVDNQKAWLGTSNLEGDYFYNSRNISLIFDSARFAQNMGQVFDRYWSSSFTAMLKSDDKGILKAH